MKTEALKLADWLDKSISADDFGEMAKYYQWCQKNVSPMIRRLVEELDRLNYDLKSLAKRYKALDRTKPLSDEEMKELINNFPIIFSPQDLLSFARAIEERHGIK